MSDIVLWLVTLLLFAAGIFGIFIPAVPGIGLIFLGILFYAYITGFTAISGTTVLVFGVIALLAWVADYCASIFGARLAGGKSKAMLGTMVGALLGTFAGPPGMLIGAFVGALLGALAEGQSGERAGKIAVWSVVAVLGATVVQLVFAAAMIIAFFAALIW